jgi:hypothetical protein
MMVENQSCNTTPLDDVMEDIGRKLDLQIARADRDKHRDIYDTLENE